MGKAADTLSVTPELLAYFDSTSLFQVIVVDQAGLRFMNSGAKILAGNPGSELLEVLTAPLRDKTRSGTLDFVMNLHGRELAMKGERGFLKDTPVILYSLTDHTPMRDKTVVLEQTLRQRNLMLEVTERVLKMEDLDEIFHYILGQILEAIDRGAVGTVMVREGKSMKVVAAKGYAKEVYGFRLPMKESFLFNIFPIQGKPGRGIQSAMVSPIYHDGLLFGMINIDADHKNAFDATDEMSMEFIRSHTQIAVSNHFLFKEKVFIAHHDHLTRLHNRYYFEKEYEKLQAKALRYQEHFSLVMVDIDDLKQINDVYGHLAGDSVIRRIADALKKSKRISDILARYGGDEFIGIYFNATPASLQEKMQEIIRELEGFECDFASPGGHPSFSYGIAEFPGDGVTLEALMRTADERMYQDKLDK